MAGVGVMFYVLLALRAELRARGVLMPPPNRSSTRCSPGRSGHRGRCGQARRQQPPPGGPGPQGASAQGRCPRAWPLFTRQAQGACRHHVRLWLCPGPRINAAGRLADMTLGIECLLTDDAGARCRLAATLDGINRERREIEGGMREQAMLMAESLFDESEGAPPAISVFDPDFHEGVVGIVASRIGTSCTAPPLCLPPAARRARSMNSKARAAPSPAFTCAMRWTWRPSATPVSSSNSAATPWRRAARWTEAFDVFEQALPRSPRNGWTPPPSPARSKPTPPGPGILPRRHCGHPAPRGVGPGFLPHLQRRGAGAGASAWWARPKPPLHQAHSPGQPGGRHLVWPH